MRVVSKINWAIVVIDTSSIPIDHNDVTRATPPTNTLLVKMRTFYGPFKTFF